MRIIHGNIGHEYFHKDFFLSSISCIICVYGINIIPHIEQKQFYDAWKIDSTTIFYNWDFYFIWSDLKIKPKIEQQYFQSKGAYYMWKYGYFDVLRAKVGVRIIRGCVLYAENYGRKKSVPAMKRFLVWILKIAK